MEKLIKERQHGRDSTVTGIGSKTARREAAPRRNPAQVEGNLSQLEMESFRCTLKNTIEDKIHLNAGCF